MTPESVTTTAIPVASIQDPIWNSRVTTSAEEDAALIESVRTEGVKTPIRVRLLPADPSKSLKYILIYGSRRLMAARAAKLDTIRADVLPPLGSSPGYDPEVQAMMDNVVENMQRRNLTPYETARALADLRAPGGDEKRGFKLDIVATRTGLSKPHISNMVTIYLKVAPTILNQWRDQNPVATVSYLRELAGFPDHVVQEQKFAERVKLAASTPTTTDVEDDDEEEEDDGDDASKKKPDKKYHILVSRANKLKRALKAKKQPAISIAAVNFLIGKVTEISGVISDEVTDD